jgi:hypothetical protein
MSVVVIDPPSSGTGANKEYDEAITGILGEFPNLNSSINTNSVNPVDSASESIENLRIYQRSVIESVLKAKIATVYTELKELEREAQRYKIGGLANAAAILDLTDLLSRIDGSITQLTG